jgi:hypothetical protein
MRELLCDHASGRDPDICVTDDPENFRQVGARFFGSRLTTSVNLVSL